MLFQKQQANNSCCVQGSAEEGDSCIPSVKQVITQLPGLSTKDKVMLTKALTSVFGRRVYVKAFAPD